MGNQPNKIPAEDLEEKYKTKKSDNNESNAEERYCML